MQPKVPDSKAPDLDLNSGVQLGLRQPLLFLREQIDLLLQEDHVCPAGEVVAECAEVERTATRRLRHWPAQGRVHELQALGHSTSSCTRHRRYSRLPIHARLADVLDRHGRALKSIYVVVLEHPLNASHVDAPKALMPELKRGHRSNIRQWGHVHVVEPGLPRAARSDLVANLNDRLIVLE